MGLSDVCHWLSSGFFFSSSPPPWWLLRVGGSHILGGWEAVQKAGSRPCSSISTCEESDLVFLISEKPKIKSFHVTPPEQKWLWFKNVLMSNHPGWRDNRKWSGCISFLFFFLFFYIYVISVAEKAKLRLEETSWEEAWRWFSSQLCWEVAWGPFILGGLVGLKWQAPFDQAPRAVLEASFHQGHCPSLCMCNSQHMSALWSGCE